MISRRFVNFVLVGGLAASLNWGSRFVFDLAMPFEAAVVPAYLIGMVTAFALNRLVVFESSARPLGEQAWRFTLVNMAALAQIWLVSVGLERLLFPAIGFEFHSKAIAHGVGVASPVFTSYLLHKHWTFSQADKGVTGGRTG